MEIGEQLFRCRREQGHVIAERGEGTEFSVALAQGTGGFSMRLDAVDRLLDCRLFLGAAGLGDMVHVCGPIRRADEDSRPPSRQSRQAQRCP
ncbi:hypothetical protein [Paenirhodobacter sp.]|uniref:hypothetical protein n=1 Tax=Paenirhodobacter sp. TaxID=1965326 RepID=UPI003B3D9FC5